MKRLMECEPAAMISRSSPLICAQSQIMCAGARRPSQHAAVELAYINLVLPLILSGVGSPWPCPPSRTRSSRRGPARGGRQGVRHLQHVPLPRRCRGRGARHSCVRRHRQLRVARAPHRRLCPGDRHLGLPLRTRRHGRLVVARRAVAVPSEPKPESAEQSSRRLQRT